MSEKKSPELGSAAERRADYTRALKEELEMCKAAGKTERVKVIQAELKRAATVKGRGTPDDETTEA